MTTVVAARPDDAPEVEELIECGYRGDSARRGWTHEADILYDKRCAPGQIAGMLADPAVTILLARSGKELLGCVALTRRPGGVLYLGMLCVMPDLQSAGLGRTLLDAAEDLAREEGTLTITMQVIDTRHSLIAWYERRGYAQTGETAPFPVSLDPPLTFTILEKRLETA
ncbi:GNAT family N-acetyltransferase [Paraurantiacibacter namhicola]|uniref:Putative acetyltransferase n=1 Tax=Paraurantiacibacter namhicola TaxID=645517 RepID=A0A1C7D8B9_9SPHN|nr:GNAT family N-acetyltransferase [Paraurantiacibacter namhicola]ANU07736.1 putative acetyltransferase [Paraurantiacibacter namhicola]